MQRRAVATQLEAGEVQDAAGPLEADTVRLAEIAVPGAGGRGEHDVSDFRDRARRMASQLANARHTEIRGAAALAPLATPEAFRAPGTWPHFETREAAAAGVPGRLLAPGGLPALHPPALRSRHGLPGRRRRGAGLDP